MSRAKRRCLDLIESIAQQENETKNALWSRLISQQQALQNVEAELRAVEKERDHWKAIAEQKMSKRAELSYSGIEALRYLFNELEGRVAALEKKGG